MNFGLRYEFTMPPRSGSDEYSDFDPTRHYQLTVTSNEMTNVEREAQAQNVDDIELDV